MEQEIGAADMKKDNKGFSLVELIIVVAIMAVLTGFIFFSFSLLTGQEARQCAVNLSTALDKEKNYALTRSGTADCYLEITKETDGYYAAYYAPKNALVDGTGSGDFVLLDKEKIGKQRVSISCEINGSTVVLTGSPLRITYNRITGAFKNVSAGGSSGSCEKITVELGRTYEFTLYPATGKHTLDRVG